MELKRVKLKPNSPDFVDDEDERTNHTGITCEMPGCDAVAEHKAPKSRGENDFR